MAHGKTIDNIRFVTTSTSVCGWAARPLRKNRMREKGGRGKGEENRSPSPLPDTRMPASSLGDRMAV